MKPLSREQFPSLRDQIGEDPARYLDRDDLYIAKIRIRGIDFIEVVRAWKAVERRIDRGPREEVMQLLEERESFLQEHGERDERAAPADRDVRPKEVFWIDEDGRRYKRVDTGFGVRKKEYLEEES